MHKTTTDPIGTLSVGNVVSASVTLYKSNFRDYFQIALRATGWVFLVIAALAILGFIVFVSNQLILLLPLGIGWLILTCYCSAKYVLNRAIVSRLAHQQLIDRPETVSDATRLLTPDQWKFFRLSLWLTLLIVGIVMLAYLIVLIGVGIGILLVTQLQSVFGYILAGIVIFASVIAAIWLALRFSAYWFIAELPLAIEGVADQLTALESIGRSRQLAMLFVGRIQLIILVAFWMTLPITMSSSVPGLATGSIAPIVNGSLNMNYFLVQILSIVLSLVVDILVLPFWQSIKAVIYFDLRSRREGVDLQMR